MFRKLLALTVVVILSVSFPACGGSNGPMLPDDSDTDRIVGISFRIPVPSLIAFSRGLEDEDNIYGINNELFVMFPNGTNEHRLTDNPADDNQPAFSPSGHSLAFLSNRSSGGYGSHDVYRLGPYGFIFQLTDETWQFNSLSTDWGPGFIVATQLNTLVGAPFDVGRAIALHPYGNWEQYINLHHGMPYDITISPNGKMAVFSARPNASTYMDDIELWLYFKGWDHALRLTYFGDENTDPMDLVYTTEPQFDSAGRRIIFQSTYWDENSEIGYIDLLSTTPEFEAVRLTFNSAADLQPCWGPKGNWFAWCSDREDDNMEIYRRLVWDPDSPTPMPPAVRLTVTSEDESNPDWSPIY